MVFGLCEMSCSTRAAVALCCVVPSSLFSRSVFETRFPYGNSSPAAAALWNEMLTLTRPSALLPGVEEPWESYLFIPPDGPCLGSPSFP